MRAIPEATLGSQIAQLARFGAVGMTCYVASIAMFAALGELLHVQYLVAFVLTFLMGNVLGFWLNGRFTYAARDRLNRSALLRYVAINVALLVLSFFSMRLLVESFRVWYIAANVIVAAVNAPLSFLLHRSFSYRVAPG